jgi:hypothetical protein
MTLNRNYIQNVLLKELERFRGDASAQSGMDHPTAPLIVAKTESPPAIRARRLAKLPAQMTPTMNRSRKNGP